MRREDRRRSQVVDDVGTVGAPVGTAGTEGLGGLMVLLDGVFVTENFNFSWRTKQFSRSIFRSTNLSYWIVREFLKE